MRYFILLVLFAVTTCYSQTKDCSKFKIGTFKYPDSKNLNLIITRNDSIQIEFNENTNFKMVGVIDWLSDCQYTLTYTEASDPRAKGLIGVKFIVDITNTLKNSYTYRAYNNEKEITGEIIKVKNSYKH